MFVFRLDQETKVNVNQNTSALLNVQILQFKSINLPILRLLLTINSESGSWPTFKCPAQYYIRVFPLNDSLV